MSVSELSVKNVYDGDDVTTVFAFTFDAGAFQGNVKLFKKDALGVVTDVTSKGTIGIAAGGVGGGVLYPWAGPGADPVLATGEKLIIKRVTALTQAVDLKNQGALDAEVLENSLDKLTLICQELQEQLDRATLGDIDT